MTTSAVSSQLMALCISDTDAESTVFTEQNLVDAGDHKEYQIAWALRGWDPDETLTIEKQTAGEGAYAEVSSGFTTNYLTGTVTFAAEQGATDVFRATGKRFATTEVVGLKANEISIGNKLIEVSDMDDEWDVYIKGKGNWKISTDMWWLCTDDVPAQDYLDRIGDQDLWVQFYSYDAAATKTRFVGRCILDSQGVSGDAHGAMGQKITITGDGPLERETYSA